MIKFYVILLLLFLSISLKNAFNFSFLRPQTPLQPYPYTDEEVRFKNSKDNIQLAGTLTYMKNEKAKYCVVLAHASGGNTRDAEHAHHKTFMVLADHLTREKIVVLRFDERGIGDSEGNFSVARVINFAEDVIAGIDYLKKRQEFKSCKFGVIGHSKGGITAMLAANISKYVEFIVLLGAPAIDLSKVFLKQIELVQRSFNRSESEINLFLRYNKKCFDLIKSTENTSRLRKELLKATIDMLGTKDESLFTMFLLPWFKDTLQFKPENILRRIKIPVLGIYGSLDIHVTPDDNMNATALGLKLARNKNFKLIKMKNLNHLFQTATTGSPGEFGLIRETIAPKVLHEIATWINSLSLKKVN